MKAAELEVLVSRALETTAPYYEAQDPNDWWPRRGIGGQGAATSWVWAIVLYAARARHVGGRISFSSPYHGKNHREVRKRLVETLWTDDPRRTHEPYEVLVDFIFHEWDSQHPIWLTAESELYAEHGVGDSLTSSDDYSWDFYKLLVVPSPFRLFVARVGDSGVETGDARCDTLVRSLSTMVQSWGRSLLRINDELGVVLLPENGQQWQDLRILCLEDGQLVQSRPWS